MHKKQKIRVAAADDHQVVTDSLRFAIDIFVKDEMEMVIEAKTGQELFDQLLRKKADVLILDLQMPDIDGEKTCRFLTKKYPQMKIIIFTFHRGWHLANSLIKAGVRGFLTKDYGAQKEIEAIKAVLNGEIFMLNTIPEFFESTPEKQKLKQINREDNVLELVVKGYKNREIARELGISVKTVEKDKRMLFLKTGTSNSTSLAMFAVRSGMVKIKKLKSVNAEILR